MTQTHWWFWIAPIDDNFETKEGYTDFESSRGVQGYTMIVDEPDFFVMVGPVWDGATKNMTRGLFWAWREPDVA